MKTRIILTVDYDSPVADLDNFMGRSTEVYRQRVQEIADELTNKARRVGLTQLNFSVSVEQWDPAGGPKIGALTRKWLDDTGTWTEIK